MADTLEIVVNVDQAKAYIEDRRQALVDVLAQTIDAVNQQFADAVRGNLQGGVLEERSGKLLSTVMQEPAQVSGEEVYGAVTAGGDEAPYGIYFEKGGTGYYDIAPVNARALAFISEGQLIFAKMVHHPPIPHLPWFEPAVDPAADEMANQLNAAFQEVLA
jgi:hypothetical protein